MEMPAAPPLVPASLLPPLPLSIRQAALTDIDRICEIERRSYPHPWSLQMLAPEFTHPWSRFRVALLSLPTCPLVGYCLSWIVPDELHILNVAVDPVWRRRGIARFLLNDALVLAREARAERICLEVRVSNTPAFELYSSFQFQVVSLRKKYYSHPTEDALVLIREMATAG